MSIGVERITHESETILKQDGRIIMQQKHILSEKFNFSPNYFSPSEKLLEFFAAYPGMEKFQKAVCYIITFLSPGIKQKFLSSKKEAMIRLSNTLQSYACDIVFSDRPIRTIAENGIFTDEFRKFIGPKRYRMDFFPWLDDIE